MKRLRIFKIVIFLLLFSIFQQLCITEIVYADDPFGSQEAFLAFLAKMGVPTHVNGKAASYNSYKTYHMIIYGTPQDIADNDYKDGQYRYLGYTQYGEKFPNPDFPPDIGASGPITEWGNWVKVDGAQESWNSFGNYPKTYNQNTVLIGYDNENTKKYTAADIGFEYAKLLSPATAMSVGVVYTRFINKYGYIRYATFRIPKINISISGNIATDQNIYVITPDKDSVTVCATINVQLQLSSGLVKNDISKLIAEIDGTENSGSQITSISVSKNIVLSRSQYGPGTHTVTIQGSGSYATTFRDADKKVFTKNITLIVYPPNTNAQLTGSVTTTPTSAEFDGNDITVKVNVSGQLSNYTDTSNIKQWEFSAYKKGESSSTQQKNINSSSTSSSTEFTFTIPKSTLSGENSYTQTFVGTFKVVFKNPIYINNVAYSSLSGTAEATITITRKNHAPVAKFTISPTSIIINQNITVTNESYDPDGDPIVQQNWIVKKNGVQVYSGSTCPTNFRSYGTGNYEISLLVKDNPPVGTALWSEPYTVTLTVVADNQKPVACFTITPNPALVDEPIVYNDTSYDPEGKSIVSRVWTVKCLETGNTYQFVNQTPPSIFEDTGWDINKDGIGTYLISLKVLDTSPNSVAPAKWSDEVSQILVVQESLGITDLTMVDIVNPPEGTFPPIFYPVPSPVKVKAGYRMTFDLGTTGGNKVDIKIYANGQPLTVYTDEGATTTITKSISAGKSTTTSPFWVDKDLPKNTLLDMKIVLQKITASGRVRTIVNTELGYNFARLVGSAKQDSIINLTH